MPALEFHHQAITAKADIDDIATSGDHRERMQRRQRIEQAALAGEKPDV